MCRLASIFLSPSLPLCHPSHRQARRTSPTGSFLTPSWPRSSSQSEGQHRYSTAPPHKNAAEVSNYTRRISVFFPSLCVVPSLKSRPDTGPHRQLSDCKVATSTAKLQTDDPSSGQSPHPHYPNPTHSLRRRIYTARLASPVPITSIPSSTQKSANASPHPSPPSLPSTPPSCGSTTSLPAQIAMSSWAYPTTRTAAPSRCCCRRSPACRWGARPLS